MKEITAIIAAYDCLDFTRQKAALATVVRVAGSSYRREGARMLITDDGNWTGGISGGCLEGDTLKKANLAIFQQKTRIVRYDTTQDDPFQIGVGLGCKGIIDVLIEPIDPADGGNPVQLLRMAASRRERSALAIVTATESPDIPIGTTMLLFANGDKYGRLPIGDFYDFITMCATGVLEEAAPMNTECQLPGIGKVGLAIEALLPPVHLVLLGSNYDVLPLLEIGKTMGWKLTVVGNLHKIGKAVFDLAAVVPDFAELPTSPDDRTVAVLMSHDYKTDFGNLKKILPANLPYIGLLGPRKRTERMLEDLEKEHYRIFPVQLDTLHGPAGLDIGATTPETIALSIASEIQAVFGERGGGFLRERSAPIYERKTAEYHA
ncbi:MAG: XdhC family protein [Bacteroidetes bacterium]|nr:XdhC family protein [Bacteroidota bacterium]